MHSISIFLVALLEIPYLNSSQYILPLLPKVVSPSGAKQPAALHRCGVRTPTGVNFPACGKKNPIAVLLIAWAV